MKRFLRIVSTILLIVAIYVAWGFALTNKEVVRDFVKESFGLSQPCEKPLTFSVGRVDAEFGLPAEQVQILSQEAASFWNGAAGREVLRYDPSSTFKINLIFDERQESTLEARKMEEDLEKIELVYDSLSDEYKSLNDVYKKKVDAYNEEMVKYRKDTDEYNREVEKWNSRGGAPEEIYEKLKDEQKKLAERFKKLESQRSEINSLVKKSNNLVAEENKVARKYNQNLNTYQARFGNTREFEKGLFSGTEINVYQFREKADLKLTLIHELGHYLGLDHVENPKSVMYYLIGEQDLENPTLTEEDLNALRNVCRL
jgi:hypothetical protein